MEISHRDYWVARLDNGGALLISRNSSTGHVLVSPIALTLEETHTQLANPTPPQRATFDPDTLTVGTVLVSESGKHVAITKITKMSRRAVTLAMTKERNK